MNEVVLFFVIILFPQSIPSFAEAKQVNGLSIDLIHRDSPLSPFYDSSMTQREVILNAAMRSISRNSHFQFTADQGSKSETVLIPNNGDYLIKFLIGSPSIESFAIADTASNVIWVQCLPCEQCYKQKAPIFDPKQSATYEEIPCNSESCNLLEKRACGNADQCRYILTYTDQSYSEGDLVKDTISFAPNDSRSAFASPKTIFGCGHVNTGLFESTSTGLVGLGGGPLSLVSQQRDEIGHIFSYCLLPSTADSSSKLKFGSESTMPGDVTVTTPFVYKSHSAYYLSLNGVTIEDVKLQSESLDIIIDSGTTLTFLGKTLYDSVETAIANATESIALRFPPDPFKLCYKLPNIDEFPDITFNFAGADVHLQKVNIFATFGQVTCLAMVPTNGVSVFGNQAQINFKVEYDLQRKTVSFAPADCTKE